MMMIRNIIVAAVIATTTVVTAQDPPPTEEGQCDPNVLDPMTYNGQSCSGAGSSTYCRFPNVGYPGPENQCMPIQCNCNPADSKWLCAGKGTSGMEVAGCTAVVSLSKSNNESTDAIDSVDISTTGDNGSIVEISSTSSVVVMSSIAAAVAGVTSVHLFF